MAKSWETSKNRLSLVGPDGNLLPAIHGNESDAELRELVLEFSRGCPIKLQHSHCPFCLLGGLPPDTLRNLARTMSRQTMLYLFETEYRLRNQSANHSRELVLPDAANNQPRL
jgi:hypothetical protein